jgi:Kdo2-lipid IVA lauroyltransferase/acyltransferase
MLVKFGIALLWLLHFLPVSVLSAIGRGIGLLVYLSGHGRVTRINLRACFPQLSETQRERLGRQHFRCVGRSSMELPLLWWSPVSLIKELVQLEGAENYLSVRDRPVIFLAPHFVGLDMGGARMAAFVDGTSLYSRQKNPDIDALMRRARTRFGNIALFPRQEGLRPVLRAMRCGLPFYFLPDMDFGPRDSIFVPFFGVPAATVTALHRICRITGALVVPCVTRQLPEAGRYVTTLYPPWENFPTSDVVADTRRMNEFIEERVKEMPEQYFWLHKRFRTRPPGEEEPFYR